MRTLRSSFGAVVGATALALSPASSQTAGNRPTTALTMEQQVRDRWMHSRQQSRFAPFGFDRSWLSIDSLRRGSEDRRLYLTLARSIEGRDSAIIVRGRTGRVAQLHIGLAPFSRRGPTFPGDSARFAGQQRRRRSLAELHLRDVVPTFPQGTPRVGLSWRDTIAFAATDGPFRHSLRGSRISRIVGDTIIDGRRLWVVRDSAAVAYQEQYLETEHTLDTTVQVSHSGAGTVRGVHLYDAELGLFRWRDDTTQLVGDAVLRYPDGRSFRTPARYDRTRRFDLYDSTANAARRAELRAADRRRFGGMVIAPANELERRLSDGDVALRDSIIRSWQLTSDPDEAAELFALLTKWGGRDEASRVRLDSLRIAAGDTAYLYKVLADRAYTSVQPTDTADVRAMIRFMQDPSVAWGFNASRDWLYENLVQALTTLPRAAAVGFADASVSCTEAACRMLGEQWRSAREPRLRDVGLVALLSLDPRRWADTVLALDGARHPLLRSAAMLAAGVGATWPAASQAPLPAPNSDWQAWLKWMNGVDPRYATVMAGHVGQSPRGAIAQVRFEESHRTAIRFYTARTGRDVVGELRRSYDSAPSDSVRFIFATMLQRLGALQLTEADLADAFTSGVPARVALAQQALLSHFSHTDTLMASAAAVSLLDRLVSAAVDGTRLWRSGVLDLRGDMGNLPGVHGVIGRISLAGDSLPDAIRTKWGGRVEIIAGAEWRKRDARAGGVLFRLAPVRFWGRFARVEFTLSERLARPAAEAPAHYASGTTYYLMELNGEWVVVAYAGWIT